MLGNRLNNIAGLAVCCYEHCFEVCVVVFLVVGCCSSGHSVSSPSESGSQPASVVLTGQGPVPAGFLQNGYENYTDFDI